MAFRFRHETVTIDDEPTPTNRTLLDLSSQYTYGDVRFANLRALITEKGVKPEYLNPPHNDVQTNGHEAGTIAGLTGLGVETGDIELAAEPTCDAEPRLIDETGEEFDNKEAEVRNFRFGGREIILSGLARSVTLLQAVRRGAIASFDSAKMTANYTRRQFADGSKNVKEFITSPEHKKNRRRVALAVGTLALTAAVVYAESKGFHFGLNPSRSHETAPSSASNLTINELKMPHFSATAEKISTHGHRALGSVAVRSVTHVEKLRYVGDNIWNHIQAKVQAQHPNLNHQAVIDLTSKWTNKVLSMNHISQAHAHLMPIGEKFKVPNRLR